MHCRLSPCGHVSLCRSEHCTEHAMVVWHHATLQCWCAWTTTCCWLTEVGQKPGPQMFHSLCASSSLVSWHLVSPSGASLEDSNMRYVWCESGTCMLDSTFLHKMCRCVCFYMCLCVCVCVCVCVREREKGKEKFLTIKRISRAPCTYRTRWEHRALFNNDNKTRRHKHKHIHTYSCVRRGDRHGCEKHVGFMDKYCWFFTFLIIFYYQLQSMPVCLGDPSNRNSDEGWGGETVPEHCDCAISSWLQSHQGWVLWYFTAFLGIACVNTEFVVCEKKNKSSEVVLS